MRMDPRKIQEMETIVFLGWFGEETTWVKEKTMVQVHRSAENPLACFFWRVATEDPCSDRVGEMFCKGFIV